MKQLSFVFLLVLSFVVSSCSKEDVFDELDTEAPSILILNPTSEEVFVTTDNSLVISGTAQDNKSLKSITYTNNGGANGVAEGLGEWKISNLELVEGDNMIQITATDESNNKSAASITVTKNRYLTFLGTPFVDNDVIYTNEDTELWITVNIASNDHLIESSVRLIEVDDNNSEVEEVCTMHDDGELEYGDEIKGDNVFSTKHVFNYPKEGTKRFRVSAKTLETEGEVEGFSAVFTISVLDQYQAEQKVRKLMETQQLIQQKVSELAEESLTVEEKEKILMEWLPSINDIQNVQSDEGGIKVTHKSGLESFVILKNPNFRGGMNYSNNRGRYNVPQIPLDQQTIGLNTKPTKQVRVKANSDASSSTDNTIIQNKNVLIWAPYNNDHIPAMDSSPFDDSPVELNVKYMMNDDCTVSSLKNITSYGIVVFDTHGYGGRLIITRQKTHWYDDILSFETENELIQNHISGLYSLVSMDDATYYAVTPKFIKNKLKNKFPNSIIFNASCESMKTELLANAFIGKGAKTYLGFTNIVTNGACAEKEKEFFSALVGDELLTTGESYVADLNFWDFDRYNSYLMRGSSAMHFYLGLINGDFEYGNLNGWNVTGDGRIITQLGPQKPTQGYYMGIISTGLGFTTDYGSIAQTFKVTNENNLTVRWNFLSEEFMEYVGSKYQDFLKITIIEGGNSEVLFESAIDDFADHYSLTRVSPTIVFDRGDVYMTGWHTSTFDISKYKGKTITLRIESGDISDSIYDSATLLDEISIN